MLNKDEIGGRELIEYLQKVIRNGKNPHIHVAQEEESHLLVFANMEAKGVEVRGDSIFLEFNYDKTVGTKSKSLPQEEEITGIAIMVGDMDEAMKVLEKAEELINKQRKPSVPLEDLQNPGSN